MIHFNFETTFWDGITEAQVESREQAYPDVGVIDILLTQIPAWMDANPKEAYKKSYKRLIVDWLSRQQNKYNNKTK